MLLQDLWTNFLEAFRANGNKLSTDATLVVGDIELGAVELKNAGTDDRAKVAATTAIAAGDVALAVHDPSLPALGPQTAAGSVSVTPAVDAVATIMSGVVMDQDRLSSVVELRGKSFWYVDLAAPSATHVGVVRFYLGDTNPPVQDAQHEVSPAGLTAPASGAAYSQGVSLAIGGAAYGVVLYDWTSGAGALTALSSAV